MSNDLEGVKRHIEAWRRVRIGEVVWEPISYRATGSPVSIPTAWKLRKPTEWIEACNDATIRHEFDCLSTLVEQTDSIFHSFFVRRRSLWKERPLEQVLLAARVAMILSPGYATGRPLRTLSVAGTDTKFFERNGRLITALLDARFDNEVSEIGLEVFLGAYSEGDHWLLVMDLDSSLLPFSKQRVGSSELLRAPLPGARLLLVENESCQHQLPHLPGAIAVLGTGFDLNWTAAAWVKEKNVAYWGDIDTWGLQFLGKARQTVGENLQALMMTAEVYEQHKTSAVTEPIVAGTELPDGLTSGECALYRRLLDEPCVVVPSLRNSPA